MFGTSPVLRMLLISSRKLSCLTELSVKMKLVGSPLPPTSRMRVFRSSLNSTVPYTFLISI